METIKYLLDSSKIYETYNFIGYTLTVNDNEQWKMKNNREGGEIL